MWDFSLEDDRTELRRLQHREQPELLAGSPSSDDFSSLLSTCVQPERLSTIKTQTRDRKQRQRSSTLRQLWWQC